MRYFMLFVLAMLFCQLATAQANRPLTWEEKLSDKYKVDLTKKEAEQSPKTNVTTTPQKEAAIQDKALRKVREHAAAKARLEAKEQKWEREEAIDLLVRQRQAEASAKYLEQTTPKNEASIRKYYATAAEFEKKLAKTAKVWLH